MVLPIVRYNDPVLRKVGRKVTRFDASVTEFSQDLVDTMHAAEGIGLAAQQVGKPIMLCVVDLRNASPKFSWTLDGAHPPLELYMPLTIVNPVVTPLNPTERSSYEEGCLSFPEIRADIVRPDSIIVTFQDESGTGHQLACTGLLSRCIQHEVDHLNGVLFIDRMAPTVRAKLRPALKELARATSLAGRAAG